MSISKKLPMVCPIMWNESHIKSIQWKRLVYKRSNWNCTWKKYSVHHFFLFAFVIDLREKYAKQL